MGPFQGVGDLSRVRAMRERVEQVAFAGEEDDLGAVGLSHILLS